MAFFKWYGITSNDNVKQGTTCAASQNALKAVLEHEQIKLIAAYEQKSLRYRLSFEESAAFFYELSVMLGAGIRVHEALSLLAASAKNRNFKEVLQDCCRMVEMGNSLAQACSAHEHYFSSFVCQLLAAGNEAGSLAQVSLQLARYYDLLDQFIRKMRALLLGPLITFGIFCAVISAVFWFVVPRFEMLLQQVTTPLPLVTRILIKTSHLLHTPLALGMIAVGIGAALSFLVWRRLHNKELLIFTYGVYVPGVRQWLADQAAAQFLRTVAGLLQGGVPLIEALPAATAAVSNGYFRERYEYATALISSGESCAKALSMPQLLLKSSCCALISLGERTGRLQEMFERCSMYYHELLVKKLTTIGTVVQPLILIFLGCGVTIIIISLYQPIITLSMYLD